jgi:hypothetical protein
MSRRARHLFGRWWCRMWPLAWFKVGFDITTSSVRVYMGGVMVIVWRDSR